MKNLVILIGAGASAGSVRYGINTHYNWIPPITKDIFSIQFSEILNRFEAVASFAGINHEMSDGASLEEYLKSHIGMHSTYLNLKDNRRRQLNQLPLYLQALFNHVTETFGGINYYRRLVDQLFQSGVKTTFITLNYDLLLDYAIEYATGVQLNSFGDYIAQQDKWVLLKPHGSINWFRQILTNYGQSGNTFASWKAIVNKINILKDLDGEIFHTNRLNPVDPNSLIMEQGFIKNFPVYPALAIPNGDYKFILPVINFRQILETNLQESVNFLIIGMSAYANDLLVELNKNVKRVENLLIVGNGRSQETYERLIAGAPVFKRDSWALASSKYDSGFEAFVKVKGNTSDLENFLSQL